MADTDATVLERICDHAECDAKCLTTPSGCRRTTMPPLDQKDGTVRPARTVKTTLPFMDAMTDEAIAEMRRQLEAEEAEEVRANSSAMTRTA